MHEDGFEISHLCEALGIHRNGFYQWLNASENIYQQQDTRLTPMIQDIFFEHRRRYGARRIAIELQSRGESCCRTKVRKIMDQNGLVAIQPKSFKPRTTESRHKLGTALTYFLKELMSCELIKFGLEISLTFLCHMGSRTSRWSWICTPGRSSVGH